MQEFKDMNKAKKNIAEALSWQDLPNGPKYSVGNTFLISAEHSSIKIVRAGQQVYSGNNYWNSPDALNRAILSVIIEDKTIIARAIDILHNNEIKAIAGCREFAEKLLAKTKEAELEIDNPQNKGE